MPNKDQVKQIFNDTYNVFYKKWINPNMQYDPDQMMREARELNHKYGCELCLHIIADLVACIDNDRRQL